MMLIPRSEVTRSTCANRIRLMHVSTVSLSFCEFNLKVASVMVKDVVDSSLAAELDKSAFIDSVYREMSRGK